MRLLMLMIAFLAMTFGAAAAHAQHDDIVPYEFEGKIATGGHNDGLGNNTLTLRVFGYDFGEDLGDPYFIGDPGINNDAWAVGVFPNDGLLPTNKTLGFNVLTTLQYWDGDLPVAFGPAPIDVDLELSHGSSSVHISGSGQTGTVPSIGSTGAGGRVHEHLESFLNYTDGASPVPPNAPDGIYMIGLELKLPASGLANSDPIYIVYNAFLDEEVHDEAIEWVEANLVPEPATWLLAMVAACAVGVVGRRPKRRNRLSN